MSCLQGLLARVAAEVEAQLKPNLQGLAGMFVSGYLPQAWVFVTEAEVVSFLVDSRGNASVVGGSAANPDVTIETSHELLSTALRTRNRAAIPGGPLTVTPRTSKGREAFRFLRSRLGL